MPDESPALSSREAEIEQLGPWFHNLHLPDGRQTAPAHPLGDFPALKWREIADYLPADLSGKRVLDIGCNAGFYSFALARRGAEVLGIDREPLYLRQAEWAARQFGLAGRVRFERRQVHEFARGPRQRFDIILFLGVFYHLRYPVLALDTLSRLRPEILVFQSLTSGGDAIAPGAAEGIDDTAPLADPAWPRMAFIEHTFWGDATNWWAPNHAAVVGLLRSAGFRVAARPGKETYICEPEGTAHALSSPEEWMRASGAAPVR